MKKVLAELLAELTACIDAAPTGVALVATAATPVAVPRAVLARVAHVLQVQPPAEPLARD